jgi:hypothetical protein
VWKKCARRFGRREASALSWLAHARSGSRSQGRPSGAASAGLPLDGGASAGHSFFSLAAGFCCQLLDGFSFFARIGPVDDRLHPLRRDRLAFRYREVQIEQDRPSRRSWALCVNWHEPAPIPYFMASFGRRVGRADQRLKKGSGTGSAHPAHPLSRIAARATLERLASRFSRARRISPVLDPCRSGCRARTSQPDVRSG